MALPIHGGGPPTWPALGPLNWVVEGVPCELLVELPAGLMVELPDGPTEMVTGTKAVVRSDAIFQASKSWVSKAVRLFNLSDALCVW